MELIADRTFCSVGQHGRALIPQGVGVLEPSELAPCGVELSGHAEKLHAGQPRIFGRHGKMIIPPAPGGQTLEFQVRDMVKKTSVSANNMSAVLRNKHR